MRKSVRAIVVKDDALLVMRRNKFGQEYYSLVGGGIDFGETPEEALHRELAEEASLKVDNLRLVIVQESGEKFGIQYIYTCDYLSGEPALSPESEEAKIHAEGHNLYQPLWLPLGEASEANILPQELKAVVLKGLKKGFAPEPLRLTIQE